jgi:hypothetical protein
LLDRPLSNDTLEILKRIVLADNLTSKQAYTLEYRSLEEMVYAGKRQQLWNVIPHTINTPEEREVYVSKLTQNLTSKDRWVRYLSRNQLVRLGRYQYGQHQLQISSGVGRHRNLRPLDASSPR